MTTLDPTLVAEIAKLHSTASYLWLYEVQVDGSTAFRLAASPANVSIFEGTASPYSSVTFYAANVTKPGIQRDNKGSLDRLTVAVENVTLEVSNYLETNDLTGRRVRVLCVHSANLGSTSVKTAFVSNERYTILSYETTNKAVTFDLGHWSLFGKRVPSQRYVRGRCRFQYGGPECGASIAKDASTDAGLQIVKNGFDLTLVSKDTCDLGFETKNGCKAHGALEAACALPLIHPRRFGGFPGLVKSKGF